MFRITTLQFFSHLGIAARPETGEVARDLHTTVKQALDPRGILNPGKSLPLW